VVHGNVFAVENFFTNDFEEIFKGARGRVTGFTAPWYTFIISPESTENCYNFLAAPKEKISHSKWNFIRSPLESLLNLPKFDAIFI